jgi:hypothetical protein
MTPEVHLIERMGHVRTVDRTTDRYESEWWAIPPATAAKLVGGRIYLHKAQDKPSFFGGTITGYRVETEGEWAGRVIFAFTRDAAGKGVLSRGGWGNEKKYVW